MIRAAAGSINWRKDHTIQSFASPQDLKYKLTMFSAQTKVAKSEIIRRAIKKYIEVEEKKMAKTKVTLSWKELVTTLCELNANVPAQNVVEYLGNKGINVTKQQIAGVKAAHTKKSK